MAAAAATEAKMPATAAARLPVTWEAWVDSGRTRSFLIFACFSLDSEKFVEFV
jgi:hypothetical protein